MRKLVPIAIAVVVLLVIFVALSVTKKPVETPPDNTAIHQNIEQFTLANGMRVILVPNHRVPAVSHTLWLTIGAGDDPVGRSGLAHYHEHLMFKGTPTVPDGQFSETIEKLGGSFNAFTGADFSGFYVNIAKEHLEAVMKLEADRFQNLMPPVASYEKERDVIIEERRSRIDNHPSALLAEQVNVTLFQNHPYRIPIIGWEHEMATLSAEDAKAFYRNYYHPGNMLLIVSGDVTKKELKPLAERYYGTIAARKPAQRNWLVEPPHRTEKRVVLRHQQVKQPQWSRYYMAPSLVYGDTKHAMPLMLLDQWLGGGKTSVLYRTLVEDRRLASNVSSSYSGMNRGPSKFSISVVPVPGVSLDKIERAVDELVAKVKGEQIVLEALNRAKTLFKADAVYARDGLQPIAHFVGYLAVLGLDLSLYTKWTEHVEAVTAEQIQDAARAVLKIEQSVTAELLPQQEEASDGSAAE